jgi:N-acetylneuraminic acid mutarotase
VQVKESLGDVTTATLQIDVLAGPLSISTAPNLADGTVGQAYGETISAEGGTGTGYTWSVLGGEFPAGLTLTPTGNPTTLSGTPTVFGRFDFTVQVEDSASNTATLAMQVIVIVAGATDTWPAAFTLAPDRGDCAVFTGSRILQFGGEFGASNGGEVMTPGAGTVAPMTTTNAPTARVEGTGVWTGSEMIVWGGRDLNTYFNTGGRYNPDTDTWTTVTTTGAPSARTQHSAVWTGTEMIIFGGYDGSFTPMDTGAAYDPAADSWRPLAAVPTGFAGRERHAAVWTGTHMIIWGGLDSAGNGMFDGAVYDPVGNSWTLMSTTNAPEVWAHHSAVVWTGSDLFVWGGHYLNAHNDGRRWDPVSNTWSMQGTYHIIRREFAACATSGGVFVWGGLDHFGTFAQNDGELFNFGINNWQAIATPSLIGRFNVKAWWTGRQVIVWGGKDFGFAGANPQSDGAVYTP